jgi:hypothetical protein
MSTEERFEVVEVDGLSYQKRVAKVNGGTDFAGSILVPNPQSLEDLAELVELGKETEAHIVKMYISAKAIELQRQARSTKKSGKIPQAEYDRIANAIDPDELREIWNTSDNPRAELDARVQAQWEKDKDARAQEINGA